MAFGRSVLIIPVLFCQCILGLAEPETLVCGRVVGGVSAATDAAPYIVSLQAGSVHYCAGSILNANWVVTAAHCLTSKSQVLSSTLVAGSNDVTGTASTTQKRAITSYVVHSLYTGGIAPYDIGLVYTATAFQWTSAVKPVTLPSSGVVPTGSADLYGWGSTSTTTVPSYPTMLQVAKNIPIISESACVSALGTKGADVHSTNICTGPLSGGIGICTSDSGGPLVQTSNGETILIGIVSWGKIPCGQPNSPSVYVQISDFISWISSNQ
ncbi:trypsin-like [Anastrepha ludens]|uniref:trypsin-like n=1 Tax=Anastrepha ludens TaxID=28586 RepID=UPI0023B0B4B6|nr:trypsin-like [Anastrepha ludens]XP_053960019.1 trypsin-like [Anastrepha ludens]